MLATSIGKDWMLNGRLPGIENLAFHAFFDGLPALGIVFRKERVHLFIALAMVVFSVVYVSTLFARLAKADWWN